MTEHDKERRDRAYACDRTNRESLIDAIRGLQSTDDPALLPLHDELQACLAALKVEPVKLTTRTYYEVGHGDLELFVLQVTGQSFRFVSDLECGNDTCHTFHNISGKVDNESDLKQFLAGDRVRYFTSDLLEYLVREKHLPAGNFIINVSW